MLVVILNSPKQEKKSAEKSSNKSRQKRRHSITDILCKRKDSIENHDLHTTKIIVVVHRMSCLPKNKEKKKLKSATKIIYLMIKFNTKNFSISAAALVVVK